MKELTQLMVYFLFKLQQKGSETDVFLLQLHNIVLGLITYSGKSVSVSGRGFRYNGDLKSSQVLSGLLYIPVASYIR